MRCWMGAAGSHPPGFGVCKAVGVGLEDPGKKMFSSRLCRESLKPRGNVALQRASGQILPLGEEETSQVLTTEGGQQGTG